MLARWWTLLIWALVAGAALFWGLRWWVGATPVPPNTPVAVVGQAARGDLTRLLGKDPPPPAVDTTAEAPPDARFQLIGVVTPRAQAAAREGLALIAVDGKPAKAYRVGAVIDGETILKSVAARGAMLGPRNGAPQVTLSLAPPAAANTGALPSLVPSLAPSLAPSISPSIAPLAASPLAPSAVNASASANPAVPSGPAAVAAARTATSDARTIRRMLPPPPMPQDSTPQPAPARLPTQ